MGAHHDDDSNCGDESAQEGLTEDNIQETETEETKQEVDEANLKTRLYLVTI